MSHAVRAVVMTLLVGGIIGAAPVGAQPGSLFRVFLRSGDPLPSYGEAAIVGDRVIFTLLVGAEADIRRRYQLVDLPTEQVDLDRTVAYANAVRGAHYAATRGEADYAEMTAAVSHALDELPGIADPAIRLEVAERAHRRMRDWRRRSYGYRADDLEALEELFAVVLGELRIDAGASVLAVELSSGTAPGRAEALRAGPDTNESVRLALKAAAVAETGAERVAILEAAEVVLAEASDSADLLAEVRTRLEAEREADARYARLSRELVSEAEAALERGDPEAAGALLDDLRRRDEALGWLRPRLVRELARQLQVKLQATEAYRAALDHYAAVRPALLGYEREVRPALATLDGLRPIIEAVGEMRHTSFDRLLLAATRLESAQRLLAEVAPPEDLADVHATLISAVHLAREAVVRRQAAAASGAGDSTRDAASAAAGAAMLVSRARGDLVARLFPPKPQQP